MGIKNKGDGMVQNASEIRECWNDMKKKLNAKHVCVPERTNAEYW